MRPGKNTFRLMIWVFLFICLAQGSSAAKQIAVIVNKENTTQALSAAEVTKIFKCDTRKWPSGAAITVVVRDPASPEMELLLSNIYKISPEELKAFIAIHHTNIVVVDSNEAMLKAVETIPGAIGLIDVFRITQEVKVLKIDGRLPVEYGYLLRGN
jgi:ABC-type phosphate transport system substrate-binding protein